MQMQVCFRFLGELMLGFTFSKLEKDHKPRQLQGGAEPVWRCRLVAPLWHHKGVILCDRAEEGRLVNVLPYADWPSRWPTVLLNLKTLSSRLHAFANTRSCTDSSNPLIEKVKLCEAVWRLQYSGCSGVDTVGLLIGGNISIPTSLECCPRDKSFFSSLSRGVWRSADKWKMSFARNLYSHHPPQYPFKSSPPGMTARTLARMARTQAPRTHRCWGS